MSINKQPTIWKKFWFVWSGRDLSPHQIPQRRHESLDAALAEAKRLATVCPHRPFIVLSAKCLVRVTEADKPPRVRWYSKPRATGPTGEQQMRHPSDDALTEGDDVRQAEDSQVAEAGVESVGA
jgi:hypothetical protein